MNARLCDPDQDRRHALRWRRGGRLVCAVTILLAPAMVLGQAFSMAWSTTDGGGGVSTGGGFEVSGTVGQSDASPAMTGGAFEVTGGFWPVVLPACTSFVAPDFDQDCDVDRADFDRFEACVLGPQVPYDPDNLPPGCDLPVDGGILAADFDADGDTDQIDFGVLQRCFSGQNITADPSCEM